LNLVIDASVAVKWFVPEEGHESARALLDHRDALIAPDWLLAEVANVFWKQQRRGQIDPPLAQEVLNILPGLLDLVPATILINEAFKIAHTIDHPVYDCIYLALTREQAATLVTDDRGLIRKGTAAHFSVIALDDSHNLMG